MRKFVLSCVIVFTLLARLFPYVSYAEGIYSNRPIAWGFARSRNEQPPTAGKTLDALLEKYDAYYLGDPKKKIVYLTFDNGYENGYTPHILDILKDKHVPAAFFVTGQYLKSSPDLVKRMDKEGHIVGNHSYHHPDMTKVSDARIVQELQLVKDEYMRLTGNKHMMYLRPPRGIFSERVLKVARSEGYVSVFWSLAFVDWRVDDQKGADYSYNNVMQQIHPGAVILLHSVSKDNSEALGRIIDDLRKRGYEFASLDEKMLKRHTIW
ncbi:MAG: delta-lactam-biosynthetic de-N-acetylase [Bacilli bacterium]